MIRAANGRRLKKVFEELFYKSNNAPFSTNVEKENKEIDSNKKENINNNSLEENRTEGYNDRED